MSTKASVKSVIDIKSEMEVLATKDDYKKIRETMLDFEVMIKGFREEARIHAEIIRGFDESICGKASRMNVLEVEGHVRKLQQNVELLLSMDKRLDATIARQEKLRKDNENRFDIMNQTISIEIINAVKKQVKIHGVPRMPTNVKLEDTVSVPYNPNGDETSGNNNLAGGDITGVGPVMVTT
jgi:hypothetical protein